MMPHTLSKEELYQIVSFVDVWKRVDDILHQSPGAGTAIQKLISDRHYLIALLADAREALILAEKNLPAGLDIGGAVSNSIAAINAVL